MASASIWNHRDVQHAAHFATWLKPIARAAGTAGTRIFDDPHVALETVQAWMLSLHDVPADILEEARARLLAEGITWMPRPGDCRRHCAAIAAERRRVFELQAAAIREKCEHCHGSGLLSVVIGGLDHAYKCGCRADAQALLDQRPLAIAPPRLTDTDDLEAAS